MVEYYSEKGVRKVLMNIITLLTLCGTDFIVFCLLMYKDNKKNGEDAERKL